MKLVPLWDCWCVDKGSWRRRRRSRQVRSRRRRAWVRVTMRAAGMDPQDRAVSPGSPARTETDDAWVPF